jgi:ppGpp synthetase/RelA/SpoT-type nucleotidyltranferase
VASVSLENLKSKTMAKKIRKYGIGGILQTYGTPQQAGSLTGGSWMASPDMIFEDGGTIDSKIDKLEGKALYIFQLGIKEPMVAQIMKAELDSPKFSKRGLKLMFRNGGEEKIKAEDVKSFLSGEPVEMKDDKEPYLISLKKKFNLGGVVQRFSSAGLLQFSPSTVNEVGNFFEEGGKIGFEELSKKVARRYKGKTVPNQYQSEYGEKYDAKEAKEVGDKVAAKVYRQQQAKMADGGTIEIGDYVKAKKGTASGIVYKKLGSFIYLKDKYGTESQTLHEEAKFKKAKMPKYAKGGEAPVYVENQGKSYNEDMYSGILSDFDMDGLPNADDPNPFGGEDKQSVEQMKFSKTFKGVLDKKNELDEDLNVFIDKLRNNAPSNSKIYGRTKTPFSILNKLVSTRMLDEKRGLKDLVGTTVAFDDYEDLEDFKDKAKKGLYGKVVDFDDYYANPKDGYRAYHFIIEQNGVPIELQLKTNRMKDVNVLSHDAYKNKKLNKDYMLYLTTLAEHADKGNKTAQNEFAQLMSKKSQVEKQLNN